MNKCVPLRQTFTYRAEWLLQHLNVQCTPSEALTLVETWPNAVMWEQKIHIFRTFEYVLKKIFWWLKFW